MTDGGDAAWKALNEVTDLMLETQQQRLGLKARHWQHCCEARDRAWEAYAKEAAMLAFLRTGEMADALLPGADGDAALAEARNRAKADARHDRPTTVQREHPIEAMFRRGQLRPEWKPLYERYVDVCAEAEGASVGVVALDAFVATAGRRVPTYKTRQLTAVHEKEEQFLGAIRRRAGEKAAAVFDITHRFGARLVTVMSLSQLGADGRMGRRNQVGRLLQKAYEALADHHGITAARARGQFARDADAKPVAGIVDPLTPEERAELDIRDAERAARAAAAESGRYQDNKAHAAELQRRRRAGDRRVG